MSEAEEGSSSAVDGCDVKETERLIQEHFDQNDGSCLSQVDLNSLYGVLVRTLNEGVNTVDDTKDLASFVCTYIHHYDGDLQAAAVDALFNVFTSAGASHDYSLKCTIGALLGKVLDRQSVPAECRLKIMTALAVALKEFELKKKNNEEKNSDDNKKENETNATLEESFRYIAANHPYDMIEVLIECASLVPSNSNDWRIIANTWILEEEKIPRSLQESLQCHHYAQQAISRLPADASEDQASVRETLECLISLWKRRIEGKTCCISEESGTDVEREEEGSLCHENQDLHPRHDPHHHLDNHEGCNTEEGGDKQDDSEIKWDEKQEVEKEEGGYVKKQEYGGAPGGGGQEKEEEKPEEEEETSNQGRGEQDAEYCEVGGVSSAKVRTSANEKPQEKRVKSDKEGFDCQFLLKNLDTAEEGEIEEGEVFERVPDINPVSLSIEILNVPSTADFPQLHKILERYGEVISFEYAYDSPVIATFRNTADAQKAKEQLDRKNIGELSIQVIYSARRGKVVNVEMANNNEQEEPGKEGGCGGGISVPRPPGPAACLLSASPHSSIRRNATVALHENSKNRAVHHNQGKYNGRDNRNNNKTRYTALPLLPTPGPHQLTNLLPPPPPDCSTLSSQSSASIGALPRPLHSSFTLLGDISVSPVESRSYDIPPPPPPPPPSVSLRPLKNRAVLRPNPQNNVAQSALSLPSIPGEAGACLTPRTAVTGEHTNVGDGLIHPPQGLHLLRPPSMHVSHNHTTEEETLLETKQSNQKPNFILNEDISSLGWVLHYPPSNWSPQQTIDEQMQEYTQLISSFGLTNRYILLSRLPASLSAQKEVEDWILHSTKQQWLIVEMLSKEFGVPPRAHVTFKTKGDASDAFKHLMNNDYGILVQYAPPRKANSSLWIGNVHRFMFQEPDLSRLCKLVKAFGEVTRLKFMETKNCVFASYKTKEIATVVRNHLLAARFGESRLNVDFSYADPSKNQMEAEGTTATGTINNASDSSKLESSHNNQIHLSQSSLLFPYIHNTELQSAPAALFIPMHSQPLENSLPNRLRLSAAPRQAAVPPPCSSSVPLVTVVTSAPLLPGPLASTPPQGPLTSVAPPGPPVSLAPPGPPVSLAPPGPPVSLAPPGPPVSLAPPGPPVSLMPPGPPASVAFPALLIPTSPLAPAALPTSPALQAFPPPPAPPPPPSPVQLVQHQALLENLPLFNDQNDTADNYQHTYTQLNLCGDASTSQSIDSFMPWRKHASTRSRMTETDMSHMLSAADHLVNYEANGASLPKHSRPPDRLREANEVMNTAIVSEDTNRNTSAILDFLKNEAYKDPDLLDKVLVDLTKHRMLKEFGETSRENRGEHSSQSQRHSSSRRSPNTEWRRSGTRSRSHRSRGRKRRRETSRERGGVGRDGDHRQQNESNITTARRYGMGNEALTEGRYCPFAMESGKVDGDVGWRKRLRSPGSYEYPDNEGAATQVADNERDYVFKTSGRRGGIEGSNRGRNQERRREEEGGNDQERLQNNYRREHDDDCFAEERSFRRRAQDMPPPRYQYRNRNANLSRSMISSDGGGQPHSSREQHYERPPQLTENKFFNFNRTNNRGYRDRDASAAAANGGGVKTKEGNNNKCENSNSSSSLPFSSSSEDSLMLCKVFKQGQAMCRMSAKLIKGDPSVRPGLTLDVNQRANLERLQSHLKKSFRTSLWQLGADSRSDSRHYDELCDYFIQKDRVGLLETPNHTVYMVPPNPAYVHPLKLPDANFMYAYVIAKN